VQPGGALVLTWQVFLTRFGIVVAEIAHFLAIHLPNRLQTY
jgi:hypothetical protein